MKHKPKQQAVKPLPDVPERAPRSDHDLATPRPWAHYRNEADSRITIYTEAGLSGRDVAVTSTQSIPGAEKANAALIVRAVNAHAELIESLRTIIKDNSCVRRLGCPECTAREAILAAGEEV